MSKHTPGSWVTEENQHGECHVMDEFGIAIADMAVDYSSIKKIKEHEANARLIAAAPDLLAMLVEAANFIQPYSVGQELLERIDAAIAHATGEQP